MIELPIVHDLNIVETAIAFAVEGWHVVPFKPDRSRAYSRYKDVPRPNQYEVAEVFARQPEALLTVKVPQKVVVLDLDPRSNCLSEIHNELQEHFKLPVCPVVATPRNGEHMWFALPDGIKAKNWTSGNGRFPVSGVDIRTNGGLATLPPSVRTDGCYRWKRWMPKIPQAPEPLVEALVSTPSAELVADPARQMPIVASTAYVQAALQGELDRVALSGTGCRNHNLFVASASLASLYAAGLLPDVRYALERVAEMCGLTRDDGINATRATIASGWRTGLANPRPMRDGAFND